MASRPLPKATFRKEVAEKKVAFDNDEFSIQCHSERSEESNHCIQIDNPFSFF
jgi:hypothetical protein